MRGGGWRVEGGGLRGWGVGGLCSRVWSSRLRTVRIRGNIPERNPYLEVHGTYKPIITVLITLLIIPLKGLIGVIPIISRVISPVISGY